MRFESAQVRGNVLVRFQPSAPIGQMTVTLNPVTAPGLRKRAPHKFGLFRFSLVRKETAFAIGMQPSGKAWRFDRHTRWFEPSHPCHLREQMWEAKWICSLLTLKQSILGISEMVSHGYKRGFDKIRDSNLSFCIRSTYSGFDSLVPNHGLLCPSFRFLMCLVM